MLAAAAVAGVSYTNIDWNAYMEQVASVMAGERDYMKLRGDTGPLVYPGGFVWLYALLSHLSVPSAQWVFWAMLLATSAVLLALAARLRGAAGLPVWAAAMLIMSRRVVSIFVLRLFNDGPVALLLYLAVWCDASLLATVLLSGAVAVKMSALLVLPGYAAVLLRRGGWSGAVLHAALFLAVQVAVGLPFLASHPAAYLSRAFELTRTFEHQWSVNWAMLPEQLFVSGRFAAALLICHVVLLLLFAQFRWGGIANLVAGKRRVTSAAAATRMQLESLLVGIVCARTLHYQFWAVYSGALLLLLLNGAPRLRVLLWVAAEVVFNIYPPRAWASLLLQGAHLAALVAVFCDPVPN